MNNRKMNPISWVEIYVNDMERAAKFYEQVFQFKMETLPMSSDQPMEMRAFPMLSGGEGAAGALVKMEGMPGGGSSTIVYFACEDCAAEESRVEAAGGKICQAKMSIGEFGYCAIIMDTEGNSIGLHSLQ